MAWHLEAPSNPSSVATATHRSKIYKVAHEAVKALYHSQA
jgi:hypothetical protein